MRCGIVCACEGKGSNCVVYTVIVRVGDVDGVWVGQKKGNRGIRWNKTWCMRVVVGGSNHAL